MLKLKIAFILSVFCLASCQKQEDVNPVKPVTQVEETVALGQSDKYAYRYKGQTYSAEQWDQKFKNVSENAYMILDEQTMHVFDNEQDALAFEKQYAANLVKSRAANYGQAKIRLYKDVNYRGSWTQYYIRKNIGQKWHGGFTNNEVKVSLPSSWRKQASSFVVDEVIHPTMRTISGKTNTKLTLEVRYYTGENFNGPWGKVDLHGQWPGFRNRFTVSDLRKWRIPRAFWLVTWNDNIQSLRLRFQ